MKHIKMKTAFLKDFRIIIAIGTAIAVNKGVIINIEEGL